MDRANDSEPDLSLIASLTRELGETVAARHRPPVVTRLTFLGRELEIVRGMLVVRASAVELAYASPSLSLADVKRLLITSERIEVHASRLTTRCTGPCRDQLALAAMGLRAMGDGTLRNQPQCPACRGRYRQRR